MQTNRQSYNEGTNLRAHATVVVRFATIRRRVVLVTATRKSLLWRVAATTTGRRLSIFRLDLIALSIGQVAWIRSIAVLTRIVWARRHLSRSHRRRVLSKRHLVRRRVHVFGRDPLVLVVVHVLLALILVHNRIHTVLLVGFTLVVLLLVRRELLCKPKVTKSCEQQPRDVGTGDTHWIQSSKLPSRRFRRDERQSRVPKGHQTRSP